MKGIKGWLELGLGLAPTMVELVLEEDETTK
jgi:hypothetical protein